MANGSQRALGREWADERSDILVIMSEALGLIGGRVFGRAPSPACPLLEGARSRATPQRPVIRDTSLPHTHKHPATTIDARAPAPLAPLAPAATMRRHYRSRFLDTSAAGAGGELFEADHKAWLYTSGKVSWELRRLLQHKSTPGTKLVVHKVLKQQKQVWMAEFEFFGCQGGALKYSFKAARCARDTEALDDECTRQEYALSTHALLVPMIHWARASRLQEAKARARGLREGFIAKVGGRIDSWRTMLTEFFQSEAHLCAPEIAEGSVCLHGEDITSTPSFNSARSWFGLVGALLMMRSVCSACSCCRLVLLRFVAEFSTRTDERALNDDASIGFNDDVQRRATVASSRKRFRVDEDYKHEAAARKLKMHQEANAGRAIRTDGSQVAVTNGRWWEAQVCLEHQAGCLHELEGTRILHICKDGSRLGEPAEETIVYLARAALENMAGIPPPQA